jgi:hypothetical protein
LAYSGLRVTEHHAYFSLRVPDHPQIENSPVGVTELSDSLLYFDALVYVLVRYKVAQVHSASNFALYSSSVISGQNMHRSKKWLKGFTTVSWPKRLQSTIDTGMSFTFSSKDKLLHFGQENAASGTLSTITVLIFIQPPTVLG